MSTHTLHYCEVAPDLCLSYELDGDAQGQPIILLPSLGRSPRDFDVIAEGLARKGLFVIRPWPRGMGSSTGPLENLSLDVLAEDVLAVTLSATRKPPVVAGHAFGNFVARRLAALYPQWVKGVALLAASAGKTDSGEPPVAPDIMESIYGSSDLSLPDEARILHLKKAFFAPENDPRVWLDGWFVVAKKAQGHAYVNAVIDDFFDAGGVPLLDVQALDDTIAPRRFSHILSRALGSQVSTVLIERAGHALLPEQPQAVVNALTDWVHARWPS